jgi:glutamyl-tRNA synthetase
LYRRAFVKLKDAGRVYPCACSRQDVQRAASAPHGADDEVVYPGTCRPENARGETRAARHASWRFRVSDGETIEFEDALRGQQRFVAGRDFGDFVVWSERDDRETAAYQLAVVVDDADMRMTEVVRGADLLVSTARQLLLYRALGLNAPAFCHCPLATNAAGVRLAKRDDAMSLRALRQKGLTPEEVRGQFQLA